MACSHVWNEQCIVEALVYEFGGLCTTEPMHSLVMRQVMISQYWQSDTKKIRIASRSRNPESGDVNDGSLNRLSYLSGRDRLYRDFEKGKRDVAFNSSAHMAVVGYLHHSCLGRRSR
jgi:hypothetical protein